MKDRFQTNPCGIEAETVTVFLGYIWFQTNPCGIEAGETDEQVVPLENVSDEPLWD